MSKLFFLKKSFCFCLLKVLFLVIFFNKLTNSDELFFFKTKAIFFDSASPPLLEIIGKHLRLLASIAILPNGSSQTEFPIAISELL